jgi:ketosteroid isomerase-like protein
MKMRFLFAFAALEIGLAVQALAPGLVNLSGDAKTLDEFIALSMKEAEAFNNNDAAALAALFADDAIYAAPEGVFYGRNAIEKRFADLFQRWHPTNFIGQTHKMNAMGNEPWAVGEWWCTLESQNGLRSSQWLLVRDLCSCEGCLADPNVDLFQQDATARPAC